MPINPEDVQPAVAPAPAPSGAPEPEIPEEVLRIPAINGLLQGKPAAVYAPTNKKGDPDIETVLKNGQALIDSGFAFYAAKSQPVNVLYNRLFLDDAALEKADAEGNLDSVAEPFDDVRASFDSLRKKAPTEGAPAPAPVSASPGPGGPPAPASVQNKLATARLNALEPGAANGAGRILSAIQKPVV
ncbi:MAG: hypothetical protein HOO67_06120 [Candidatus Peribacteraceae bacterium]|nr:hypothetical protein [Candidatus Peribacteraceae bacterium]